ncbi:hypothetical protein [Pedobacter sp. L105]|uniref:hypothetical protein n=1 Tax=Pedobacter sp. L105 TaxID=1641871 RepID=UPI00131DB643|nr:hypothetical protein [Pedobacter sp. L105]
MPAVPHYRRWFNYIGGSTSSPSSYIYSPAAPSCRNGSSLCAVYGIYIPDISPGINIPGGATFSANMQNYISNLFSTGLAQPTGVLIHTIYVYGKS